MYNSFDLIFFLGSLLAVLAIGLWTTQHQKTTVNDYFRGGNRLPWYAIGFSIIAAGISSEQFVGEIGYAYRLGMPVANWEWLVLPALTILLWVFVPLYVRNNITTMPEYLEKRFGGNTRTLYAYLTVASYVFVNFALVFYTGGFALEQVWGIDKIAAVWLLAFFTGLYTVYGGLEAMAWTSSLQCVLLMGGGLYVFFAGMSRIGWDFAAVISTGDRAHLITAADHPEVPWTTMADYNVHLLPTHLENPMVLAGAVNLFSWTLMACLTDRRSLPMSVLLTAGLGAGILALAVYSPVATAATVGLMTLVGIALPVAMRTVASDALWDFSMLRTEGTVAWYANVWLWWGVLAAVLCGLYWHFW